MDESTHDALRIARSLIDAGIPVFAAAPCPSANGGECLRPGHSLGAVEYDLPPKWQLTIPSRVWLDERWQPGWALAAVGGHAADFLDEDPRNGGDASVGELSHAGAWPTTFGEACTPSGGRHYLISALRERKATGFLPGLDYQGGAADGQGRGFVWIAPTVRRSKVTGEPTAYRWTTPPDLDWLAEFRHEDGSVSDDSTDGVRLRLAAYRSKRSDEVRTPSDQGRYSGEARRFTEEQARAFCDITLKRLAMAPIGRIEEETNAAACALSHFVPGFWSEEAAYSVLLSALGETAYDPEHPASTWEADKFHAVLVGQGRAPSDWHAVREPATPAEAMAAVTLDEVGALLAEMVTPSALAERRPPRYMIKDLLTYDSETQFIGGPGSKKSFTVLDMAGHVALGRPWQGRRVNQGIVVMIVGEGAGSMGKRVAAWQKINGPMPDDRLRILPRPVQAKELQAWAVLVKACERLRAVTDPSLGMFVVVDTQARVTVGLDENSAEQMGVYISAVNAIRTATGACVMSVHHTTKTSDSTRGSGAQDGAQDTRLLMKSKPGTLEGWMSVEKQKDLEEVDPFKLEFVKIDLGLDEDGEHISSLVLLDPSQVDQWRPASMTAEAREAAREAAVEPFKARLTRESWIGKLTHHNADVQQWALQALRDVARDEGLSKSEWKDLVAMKVGKLAGPKSKKMTMEASTWTTTFQALTDGSHPAVVAGIVCKVRGKQAWTLDRTALDGFIADMDKST
jgi:hypothetical protein